MQGDDKSINYDNILLEMLVYFNLKLFNSDRIQERQVAESEQMFGIWSNNNPAGLYFSHRNWDFEDVW